MLGATACGAVENKVEALIDPVHFTDPTLKPYVAEVMSWSGESLSDSILSIELVDELGVDDAIGICVKTLGSTYAPHSRKIKILRADHILVKDGLADTWNNMDDNSRLMLIAHELGHCQWNAKHVESGLMQPNLFDGDAREAFESFYAELPEVRKGK